MNFNRKLYRKPILIEGGTLCNQAEGTLFRGDDGTRLLFRGVRTRCCWLPISGTAFQLCGVVYVSKSYLKLGFKLSSFAHEYGHFLQQKEMGFWRFFFRVGVRSAVDLLRNPLKHYLPWYEQDASRQGTAYVKEHLQQNLLV